MARTNDVWETGIGGTYIQTIAPAGFDILINGSNKYVNFNSVVGTTGYGFRDNGGIMEFKNNAGAWTAIGTTGVTSINGDTTGSQTFTVGSAGTDFAIVDNGVGNHLFNLPSASATARGLMTTGTQTIAGSKTFSDSVFTVGSEAAGQIEFRTPFATGSNSGITFFIEGSSGGPSGGNGSDFYLIAGSGTSGTSNGGNFNLVAGLKHGGGINGTFNFSNGVGNPYGALSFAGLSSNRSFIFPDTSGTIALLSTAGTVTSVTSADGNATVATSTTTPVITIVSAPKFQTGRTISISGDLTYTSPSFDGSGNVTAVGTLATVNSNVGTFGSVTKASIVTVNGKGLVTAISESTITPAVGSITGLGTGVATFLATPSSANLASAITDETGSGSLVFATSPALVTPDLGTPSAAVLTNATGTAASLTAGKATILATARTINTVSFDGSANIVVTAAAGTLTGTTLNATVVTSSLTAIGTITTGVWNGTAIPLLYGGTGQTTKAAAFDALSPMTTGGDLIYGGASGTGTRLANGSVGQVLTSGGTTAAPTWATPTTGTVTSVSGTANRITSSGGATPAIDIAATYVGQTSVTILGTITTGTWNASLVIGTYGGTGVNNGTKTFTYLKNISFTAADDTGVYTLPTGTKTLVATDVATLSSLASIGTITTGTWNASVVIGTYGGTGVNNGTKTLTYLKNISFTAADDTGVYTLPTGTKTLVATDVATLSSLASIGTITTGTWSATTIALNKGGTGQTTKAAAFDALQPMTTGGDIIYGGASGTGTRLANGSAGQVLTSGGTTVAPSWTNAGTGTVTAVTGTTNRVTSSGGATPAIDISASYVGQASITTLGTISSGTWNGTAIPLLYGGTGQTTQAAAFDALQPMTTGGDLIYGGASGTGTRLPNGSAGQVLTSAGGTSAPSWTSAGSGTVSSVATDSTLTGGTITTTGTLGLNLSNANSWSANIGFAASGTYCIGSAANYVQSTYSGYLKDRSDKTALDTYCHSLNDSAGSIAVKFYDSAGVNFLAGSGASAPTPQGLIALPLSAFGAGTINQVMGTPDAWLSIFSNNTAYKMGLYLP